MKLPEILNRKTVARSRLFKIETLDLLFSNGVERTYERLPQDQGRVIVVAVNDKGELLLTREYALAFTNISYRYPKAPLMISLENLQKRSVLGRIMLSSLRR